MAAKGSDPSLCPERPRQSDQAPGGPASEGTRQPRFPTVGGGDLPRLWPPSPCILDVPGGHYGAPPTCQSLSSATRNQDTLALPPPGVGAVGGGAQRRQVVAS